MRPESRGESSIQTPVDRLRRDRGHPSPRDRTAARRRAEGSRDGVDLRPRLSRLCSTSGPGRESDRAGAGVRPPQQPLECASGQRRPLAVPGRGWRQLHHVEQRGPGIGFFSLHDRLRRTARSPGRHNPRGTGRLSNHLLGHGSQTNTCKTISRASYQRARSRRRDPARVARCQKHSTGQSIRVI